MVLHHSNRGVCLWLGDHALPGFSSRLHLSRGVPTWSRDMLRLMGFEYANATAGIKLSRLEAYSCPRYSI